MRMTFTFASATALRNDRAHVQSLPGPALYPRRFRSMGEWAARMFANYYGLLSMANCIFIFNESAPLHRFVVHACLSIL